jgi:hypothetical protein
MREIHSPFPIYLLQFVRDSNDYAVGFGDGVSNIAKNRKFQ